MRNLDAEFLGVARSVKEQITGRYAQDTRNATYTVYYIKEYRSSTNELIMRRVFDPNQILLDNPQSSVSEPEEIFLANFNLLSQEEEAKLVDKMQNSNDHIL